MFGLHYVWAYQDNDFRFRMFRIAPVNLADLGTHARFEIYEHALVPGFFVMTISRLRSGYRWTGTVSNPLWSGRTGGHTDIGVEVAGSQGVEEHGRFRRIMVRPAYRSWIYVQGLQTTSSNTGPLFTLQGLERFSPYPGRVVDGAPFLAVSSFGQPSG